MFTYMFSDNKNIVECLVVGLISSICCLLSYKIIYYSYNKIGDINDYHLDDIKDYIRFLKMRESRNNILMCFILGALVHYIVKQSHLTEMYCRKVCYDDKCFMVCNLKKD